MTVTSGLTTPHLEGRQLLPRPAGLDEPGSQVHVALHASPRRRARRRGSCRGPASTSRRWRARRTGGLAVTVASPTEIEPASCGRGSAAGRPAPGSSAARKRCVTTATRASNRACRRCASAGRLQAQLRRRSRRCSSGPDADAPDPAARDAARGHELKPRLAGRGADVVAHAPSRPSGAVVIATKRCARAGRSARTRRRPGPWAGRSARPVCRAARGGRRRARRTSPASWAHRDSDSVMTPATPYR